MADASESNRPFFTTHHRNSQFVLRALFLAALALPYTAQMFGREWGLWPLERNEGISNAGAQDLREHVFSTSFEDWRGGGVQVVRFFP